MHDTTGTNYHFCSGKSWEADASSEPVQVDVEQDQVGRRGQGGGDPLRPVAADDQPVARLQDVLKLGLHDPAVFYGEYSFHRLLREIFSILGV